jgi:hypothetical protein
MMMEETMIQLTFDDQWKENLIVSFSGGVGSAATALAAFEHGLEFQCVFADTLIEDEDLHRFMDDVAAVIGQTIVKLSCGMTPWDVFRKVKYIGNTRTAHCSQKLKTDVVREWIKENYTDKGKPATLILGMGRDEQERIERAKKSWSPVIVDSLLDRFGMHSHCSRTEIIEKYGIKLPRLYSYGFPHNNCGGFCVRSGQTQFATLLKHFPERYQWHVEQEEIAYREIGETARPFLRKNINGVVTYMKLSEFRDGLASGEITADPYEFGGCACFIDEE